jgi:predicted transposase YbfD/YdcC
MSSRQVPSQAALKAKFSRSKRVLHHHSRLPETTGDFDVLGQPTRNPGLGIRCDTGHGRRETRTYVQMPVPKELPGLAAWPGVRTIGAIVSCSLRDGREVVHARYYVSSLRMGVKQFARAVRGHWGIENACHWTLDVTYVSLCATRSTSDGPDVGVVRAASFGIRTFRSLGGGGRGYIPARIERFHCAPSTAYARAMRESPSRAHAASLCAKGRHGVRPLQAARTTSRNSPPTIQMHAPGRPEPAGRLTDRIARDTVVSNRR